MPAGTARQPLDRQRRAAGRFERQALLGPTQDHPQGLLARLGTEGQIDEPLLAGHNRARVVKRNLEPARGERLVDAMR